MLAQYGTNGTPDSAFGTNGIIAEAPDGLSMEPLTAVLQADGKVVVGGEFGLAYIFEGGDPYVGRFDSAGKVDSGFANNGCNFLYLGGTYQRWVQHMAVQSNGKLLLNIRPEGAEVHLRRLLSNGFTDTTFATRGVYRRVWIPVGPAPYNIGKVVVLSNDSILWVAIPL